MISNHNTEVDPLAETWSEEEMSAMLQEEDASFGTTRGQRRLLMGIVVLGGATVIVDGVGNAVSSGISLTASCSADRSD